jgi:hypothetical protein
MAELKIDERGLLIPPGMLAGLPSAVNVRRVKAGVIIEPMEQAASRERLAGMVDALRATAGAPAPAEVAALVDETRARRASNR